MAPPSSTGPEHPVSPRRRPRGPRTTDLLRSAVRREIVDALANLPADERRDEGLTAQELGALVELHPTTVRFHLDQLVTAGFLTTHFVRSPGAGRPSKKYVLTAGELDEDRDDESYRILAGLLAEMFTRRSDDGSPLSPEEAGAAWAHAHVPARLPDPLDTDPALTREDWRGKVGQMIDVLEEWGYTPDLTTDDSGRTAEVELRECPFLPLAHDNPEVVCGVHRGLMRGTLDIVGERDAALSLIPFVGPRRCLATVTTRAPLDERGGGPGTSDEAPAR